MGKLYDVLGVKSDASADEIRKAYRRLAKGHHPDLHPGDAKAEEKFKTIAAAWDILGDKDKRARYDRGEIGDDGNPQFQRDYYRQHAGAGPEAFKYQSGAGFEDLGDIFSGLFGGRARASGGFGSGGGDLQLGLTVEFLDAANGARKRVTLPDGRSLDIAIPPGLRDGQTLRLRGKGAPGAQGRPPGDLLIEVSVAPDPRFERKGNDIHLALPLSLAEAVLGAKVEVPTVSGTVALTIPKGSNTGHVLRLKGRGIPGHGRRAAGDQLVRLEVMLPERPDAALEQLVRGWADAHPYDPRHGMEKGR
ncbi:MAG: DnaJ domain-containing protein [Azospirillum sp.]|nr:DnaJ domain-containing protein [Azospirillum sp.]